MALLTQAMRLEGEGKATSTVKKKHGPRDPRINLLQACSRLLDLSKRTLMTFWKLHCRDFVLDSSYHLLVLPFSQPGSHVATFF